MISYGSLKCSSAKNPNLELKLGLSFVCRIAEFALIPYMALSQIAAWERSVDQATSWDSAIYGIKTNSAKKYKSSPND